MSRRNRPIAALTLALVGAVAAGALAAGTGAPTSFALVFAGAHVPGVGPTGFSHKGAFSATSPACSEGEAVDVQYVHPDSMLREFRCADGSGSFTALVGSILAEHGGPGGWKILGGTGAYGKLRGRGTFQSEFTGGSPSDEASTAFRSTWRGVVGFDDVAPTVHVIRASAAKLRHPPGSYLLRLALTARDDLAENAVEYRLLATSERTRLGFRDGRTRSGQASLSWRLQPPKGARRVVLELRAADPLGNELRIVRSLTLPA